MIKSSTTSRLLPSYVELLSCLELMKVRHGKNSMAPLAISTFVIRSADLASEHLERRLTAILAADVAGYSRLTGLDEEGTHVRLREHLSFLVNPKIAEHRGRVVKNTGDGLLAEFSSAVDAVRCAMMSSEA